MSVTHQEVGGVTRNKCSIGTSNLGDRALYKSSIRRGISSILKFDIGGRFTNAPLEDKTCLRQPLRINQIFDSWVVPSAFSTSGWVERCLSFKEMGSCLDLPPAMLGQFAIWAELEPKLLQRLVRLPPVKVIQACLGFFSRSFGVSLFGPQSLGSQHDIPASLRLGVPGGVEEQEAMDRWSWQ